MTTETLRPGCFGSALIYRAGAEECARCAHGPECARTVAARNSSVADRLKRFDKKFRTDRAGPTERWLSGKMRAQTKRKTKQEVLVSALLDGWSRRGVNIYHLRHRTNPLQPGSLLHLIFDAILKLGPFKTRDILEAVRSENPRLKKVATEALIKSTCNALLTAGILKRERGVYCLTN